MVSTAFLPVILVELLVSLDLPVSEQPTHQSFRMPMYETAAQWQHTPPGQAATMPPRYVASVVALNRAARLPGPEFKVPVMLHYQPSYIRLTGMRQSDGKHVWQDSMGYLLPEDVFPRAEPASTWRPAQRPTDVSENATLPQEWQDDLASPANTLVVAEVTPEDMAREPFTIKTDQERLIGFGAANPHFGMAMGVTKVVRDDNGEPLTFYIDRVWALTKLILFLSEERVAALYDAERGPQSM